jgi:hypothetical protein
LQNLYLLQTPGAARRVAYSKIAKPVHRNSVAGSIKTGDRSFFRPPA